VVTAVSLPLSTDEAEGDIWRLRQNSSQHVPCIGQIDALPGIGFSCEDILLLVWGAGGFVYCFGFLGWWQLFLVFKLLSWSCRDLTEL